MLSTLFIKVFQKKKTFPGPDDNNENQTKTFIKQRSQLL